MTRHVDAGLHTGWVWLYRRLATDVQRDSR